VARLKILHTADFHLGAGLRGAEPNSIVAQRRDSDFIKQLMRIRDLVINNECDFLVISGDIFHSLRPSGLLLNEFSKFVASLAENDVYVLVTAGNHDQPRTSRTEAYLKAIYEARAPRFYYFNKPGSIILRGSRSGRAVKFISLPYFPIAGMEEQEYVKLIDDALDSFIKDGGNYDYLVVSAHFHVEGAQVSSSAGYLPIFDVRVPKSVFSKSDISYAALGHIHRYQELKRSIVYSGSIERMNFGEEDEDKGVVLVEEVGGDLEYRFEELPCRPLVTLPREKYGFSEDVFDLTDALSPTRKLVEVLRSTRIPEESIVRILVKLPYGRGIDRSEIAKVMREKNVMHWVIDLVRARVSDVHIRRSFTSIRDAFREYVEGILAKKYLPSISKELIELMLAEGLKIIESLERGER